VEEAKLAMTGFAPEVALDALFRRNATLRGDLVALRDLDGTSLTYAETSNAVAHVAEQIATLGLPPKSAVALLLPNGRELVVATLGVMRSGHVAVPMPIAWRKSDVVRACREAEAGALITTANYSIDKLPEFAAEVAIEVFELSFPCAFGSPLPDGLLPISFNTLSEPLLGKTSLSESSAPGIGTLAPASGGVSFVLHQDDELLAAGLGAMLAGDVRGGDTIVSAISFTTFAGLAAALVPWLLSSGTLTLLPDMPAKGSIEFDKNTHLVASSGSLASLYDGDAALASAFAIHYGGTEPVTAFPALNARALVDVIALGEVAAIALPRAERGMTAAMPLGAIHAGNTGAGSPVVAETSVESGRIHVRGAMVPKDIMRDQDWVDTAFASQLRDPVSLYAIPPEELIAIGALRFDGPDLERRIRSAALVSEVYAVEDPVLGARLVVTSDRPDVTARALLDAGLPRVVAASVRKADAMRAQAL
jgi:hypothetical protein